MPDVTVPMIDRVINSPAAPAVLVEQAGKRAQNLWWDDRDESLWWTDTAGGCLYRLNVQTGIQSAIYEGPNVGAFLPQEDGTWLLFREKDIAVLAFDRHEQVAALLENIRFDGDHFNEAIADAHGRVLVGTVRTGRPNGAGIYLLDQHGKFSKALGGTGESNGMSFNAAGDALYWSCGTTKTIYRCRYDGRRGAISSRQVFHECLPEEGTPAGLAIDAEGTLWSARRESGAILKIGENRRLMGQVSFPARDVTSIAFGGPNHRTAFVAAVEEGVSKIFLLQSPASGAPLHRSKISLRARACPIDAA
jgi:D-xylonolactonase